jgi:hypothetical protein
VRCHKHSKEPSVSVAGRELRQNEELCCMELSQPVCWLVRVQEALFLGVKRPRCKAGH